MFLVIAVILQVVLIYCALNNKFSDAIEVTKMSDIETRKKKTVQFFDNKNRLPSFNVQIPVNTDVNILEMVGLNNRLWIVDNVFELNICGNKLILSLLLSTTLNDKL